MSTTITPLSCSECPGNYRHADVSTHAICMACGHAVNLSRDVEPHLDANERLGSMTITTPNGHQHHRGVAVIRTEACECCGTANDHHFNVGPANNPQPCPNNV